MHGYETETAKAQPCHLLPHLIHENDGRLTLSGHLKQAPDLKHELAGSDGSGFCKRRLMLVSDASSIHSNCELGMLAQTLYCDLLQLS